MVPPQRFSYNPKWQPVACFLLLAVALLLLARLHVRAGFCLPLGALILIPGLLGILRCLVFRRSLELHSDAILLPTGFLHRKIARIPYAEIDGAQELIYPSWSVLRFGTKAQIFVINSKLLPRNAEYEALSNFIQSLPALKEKEAARQSQPVEPGKYCFQCDWDGNGSIFNSKGEILWAFRSQRVRSRFRPGVLQPSDFLLYDKSGNQSITAKRERGFPVERFIMMENGAPVCKITLRSILLNKYHLNFTDGSKWTFHMPLFSVRFTGQSQNGAQIQVRVKTHKLWHVSIDRHADSPQLVAALAFIHRERLRRN